MTKHLIPARPALAAIAAVLALGSTPVFAQDVQPQMAAPPAVTPPAPVMEPSAPTPPAAVPATPEAVAPVPPQTQAPAQTAPAQTPPATTTQAPVFKQQSPVVQPTPPRPVMATPVPEAEAAPARAEAEAPMTAERAAQRTAAPETAASKTSTEPTPAEAAPAAISPVASPLTTTAAPAPAMDVPAEAQVQQVDAGMSDEAKFAMGAGAVAILAIGAAFALRRRRDPLDEQAVRDPYAPVSAPDSAAPVLRDEPAVEVRPVHEPVMAAATAGQPHYVSPVYADDAASPVMAASSLEAMIAERPSQANPFVTRKNRLRRANFLLQKGDAGVRATAPASLEQSATAHQGDMVTKEVRTQPVYDFGKVSTGWRRLTPATT